MFTPRMFDMWNSKLEAHNLVNPMQTNLQTTNVQNSSSGSIKGIRIIFKFIYFQNNRKYRKQ